MKIEIDGSDMVVDAALLGEMLLVEPGRVPALLRSQEIPSLCDRGVGEHAGEYRLSFFSGSRRARLAVDAAGNILRRSAIDFGEAAMPRQMHRAGA
mgnify:FL=1